MTVHVHVLNGRSPKRTMKWWIYKVALGQPEASWILEENPIVQTYTMHIYTPDGATSYKLFYNILKPLPTVDIFTQLKNQQIDPWIPAPRPRFARFGAGVAPGGAVGWPCHGPPTIPAQGLWHFLRCVVVFLKVDDWTVWTLTIGKDSISQPQRSNSGCNPTNERVFLFFWGGCYTDCFAVSR